MMEQSGANAFVYAKASGIIGKSFIGPRAELLFEQKKLSDLWTLLFDSPAPLIPEVLLAREIEAEAFRKFLNQYVYFINQYSKPQQILIAQLNIYDAENLKEVAAALCAEETECPELVDLGKFSKLNYTAWPDISAITRGSEYEWYNKVPDIHEQQQMEFQIDMQVIKNLWNAINATKGEDKEALLKLYKAEYVIKNIVWALRLRVHYQLEKEEIIPKLISVTDGPLANDPVAGPALEVLDMPLDDYNAWQNWTFKDLVNPMMDNGVWKIDPSWIESKNKVRVNKLALRVFHQYPMSVSSLIGWYKIKKFELSCIRTAVESLRLSVQADVAKATVGITAE